MQKVCVMVILIPLVREHAGHYTDLAQVNMAGRKKRPRPAAEPKCFLVVKNYIELMLLISLCGSPGW